MEVIFKNNLNLFHLKRSKEDNHSQKTNHNQTPMPVTNPKFNPSQDTLVITLFLHRDEEGNMIDIDTHLYYSEEHGFYLQEKKAQIWIDRCWENVTEDDHKFAPMNAPRRILSCTCRPMTTAQVIRLVVENHVPEEGGALKLALHALDRAGI